MRMSHFVVRDAIIPNLQATTRDAAIREMVEGLHAAGRLHNTDLDQRQMHHTYLRGARAIKHHLEGMRSQLDLAIALEGSPP